MGQTASRVRQSVAAVLFAAGLYGEVRLPAILSDHMVVQAGVPNAAYFEGTAVF